MDLSKMTPEDRERYLYKLTVQHKGPCSSPYPAKCPCEHECPHHGRCCDCVHLHIKNRKLRGGDPNDTKWLPACLRLAQAGEFDNLYIYENESKQAE